MTLDQLSPGKRAVIAKVDAEDSLRSRMSTVGLHIGREVTVIRQAQRQGAPAGAGRHHGLDHSPGRADTVAFAQDGALETRLKQLVASTVPVSVMLKPQLSSRLDHVLQASPAGFAAFLLSDVLDVRSRLSPRYAATRGSRARDRKMLCAATLR